MKSDLIRSRPGASEIKPASAAAALPVAEGIWLSPGLSNSYLVVTDEGRVVVNTGMGFESGHHRRIYDAVDSGPMRYIVLTQSHIDHVGGVDTFREAGTAARSRRRTSRPARPTTSASTASGSAAASPSVARDRRRGRVHHEPAERRRDPRAVEADAGHHFDDELRLRARRHAHRAASRHPAARRSTRSSSGSPTDGVALVGNMFSALFGHFPNLVTVRARPAALPAPVRRLGAARDRPRARGPAARPPRPDRRARHDPHRVRADPRRGAVRATTRPSPR